MTKRCVREIAVYFSSCGDVCERKRRLTVAPAVVTNGEKSVVSEYWTSECRAELILTERQRLVRHALAGFTSRRGTNIKRIARVERVVAYVLKRRTVKIPSTSLRNHVHNAAHCASIIGARVVAHYFKLLNQINIGYNDVRRSTNVGVDDAVEEIEFRAIWLSMKRRIGKTGTGNTTLPSTPPTFRFCDVETGVTPGVSVSNCVKLRPFKGRSWTTFSGITVPRSDDACWINSAPAVISTVSDTAPTVSVMSCTTASFTPTLKGAL